MNTTESLMARQQMQTMVNRFILDSDAIAETFKTGTTHWRVQALAVVALHDWVKLHRDCGFLLYLHDASTLFNPTDGAA